MKDGTVIALAPIRDHRGATEAERRRQDQDMAARADFVRWMTQAAEYLDARTLNRIRNYANKYVVEALFAQAKRREP